MPVKKWTLIDHGRDYHAGEITINPQDVGGSTSGYLIRQRVLKGGLSAGVTAIRIDNGIFAVEVLPTRGMGIWKAWQGGEEIGWRSPNRGPVHPAFVPVGESSGLGWLDGFDELLVRCGLESNGAPEFDEQGKVKFPLHGRIANRPAHRVELAVDGDSGEITLTGEVEETRFHFFKLRLVATLKTRVGEPGFRLQDEVHNFSGSPAEMQLLYHINFGQPLLDAGAKILAPATHVVPRNDGSASAIGSWDSYAAEEPGFAEQVYFLKLAADAEQQAEVFLRNAHGTRGVALRYRPDQLPCFTVWKNTTAAADGYVTGLEPGTNYPNPRTYEGQQGRVVKLAPGAAAQFALQFSVAAGAEQVAAVEKRIRKQQSSLKPEIFDRPQDGWCAP